MPRNERPYSPVARTFPVVIGGTALIGLGAYGLSFLLHTPLGPQLGWTIGGAAAGVAGALPLTAFLWWFVATANPTIVKFRQSQIEFFADIGFEFTPFNIAIMAVAAGVCEELMFRGVMQTWISGFAPLAVAVAAPNLLFGVLHMRTVLYAVIAGLVGVYLGVLYAATGDLLAPVVAHGVYDLIALAYTRRAVLRWREGSRAN